MKIIIAGAGAVGTHLAKLFSRDHQDCVLIDEDASRLGDLDSRYDIMTLQGRTTSINTMKDAGVYHPVITPMGPTMPQVPMPELTAAPFISR